MAGRKPKPTAIKERNGNPGGRPLNHAEPKPRKVAPAPPPHLAGEALAEWHRIAPELLRIGVLTSIDRAALTTYCDLWARYVDAADHLKQYGPVIKTKNGNLIQNPYLSIQNAAIDFMRKYLVEFGMSPSSRSKIHADATGEPDASEEKFFSQIPDAQTLLV